jgi:hypothetical protein
MRRHLFIFVLIATASPYGAAAGKKPDPDPKSLEVPPEVIFEAKELVSKLASKSFHEREQASRDLQKLGRLALPAITEALHTSANPEVQMRTELLLPAARTDDFRARIDCFLADAESKYDHRLPGAKEFFAVTGQSDASRNLFRDIILSSNRDLLLAVGKPDELSKMIAERKAEFVRAVNGGLVVIGGGIQPAQKTTAPNVVDLAAIFFAESMISEKKLGAQAGYQAVNLLHQPALKASITSGGEKEAVLAILTKWADTREEPQTIYYGMSAFRTVQPSLGVKMALRMIDTKGGTPFHRGMAITLVGQFGNAEQRAALLPLLKDETVITPGGAVGVGGKRIAIQARDIALAMLLTITKQDVADYGLTYRYKANPANDALKYNYMAHFFDGDDAEKKREDAMKKWDDWHAKNKEVLKK